MTCEIIATGSKGNAVLLNGKYLFDCGVPFGKLKPFLKNIRVVFLTHIHSDHFWRAAIMKLHNSRPTVRFVCAVNLLVPLCTECGVAPNNIVLVTPGALTTICFGPECIRINVFDLVHNVENVGYAVEVIGGEEPGKALYATDTQYIPVSAPGLDLYMVESNYRDADELRQRKERKISQGGFVYEDSVAVSHMSHETVTRWLEQNAGPHSEVVFLHQHVEKEAETVGGAETVHIL